MECKTIHKKLIFFLEGDLSEKEAEQMKLHLSGCNDCAAFAEDLRKTLGIIEEEKSAEINPFFYTRLKAKLEAQTKAVKIPFWKPTLGRVVQPVVFTILLIAGIYTGYKIGAPAQVNNAFANYSSEEIVPYLNEMHSEPIEEFLME